MTGGGIGLGKHTALQFAQRGAAVVVAEIVEETGRATVDEIRAAGGRALFVRTDVSIDEDARAMVAAAVREFGRLDFAVNNAAIEGEVKPLTEQALETFHMVISINLAGVFHGLRHQIPVMVAQGGGAIVNVASIAGVRGHPGLAPYVASEARREWADQGRGD